MFRRALVADLLLLLLALLPCCPQAQDIPEAPSSSRDQKRDKPHRGLSKLCVTAAAYTCWESEEPPDPLTDSSDVSQQLERRRIKDDMEIGADHMRHKNYRGAVGRYCDALSGLPFNASIMVRVAQALEKSGDTAAALTFYWRSVETYPEGILAGEAQAGIKRLKAQPSKPGNPSVNLAQQLGCPSEAFYRGTAELPDRP
ncbi:MAG TPA: hypothetical protein VMT28_07200 [Terriglobales bacterium]|nr:hypothetical protein [Terriglobales bacterium]